jgi:uncharacterized protein (TIGR02246 family)
MQRALGTIAAMAMAALVIRAAAPAAAQSAAQSDPGQEAAVRQVVSDYVAARERGDAAGVEALFTEHADQLVSSGEWRRGRPELVRGTLASSKSNAGARTVTVRAVRFPTPDVAIADGEYVIGASGVTAARNMWSTFVMVRGGGRWRIDAIRNMLPAPPAQ